MGDKTWSYEDMRTAMKRWYHVSHDLEDPIRALGKAKFTKAQMGLAVPIHDAYEEARSALHKLLKDGAGEAEHMADALDRTNSKKLEDELLANPDALAAAARDLTEN
jgi:hypothetical protein